MKNMKIRTKLMVSFVIVAVFAAIAGVTGVFGMQTISANEETIYKMAVNTERFTDMQRNIQQQRADYRGAALKQEIGTDNAQDLADLDALDTEFRDLMTAQQAAIITPDMVERVKEIMTSYEEYTALRAQFVDAIAMDDTVAMQELLSQMTVPIDDAVEILVELKNEDITNMDTTNLNDTDTANMLTAVMIVLAALAVVIALFFAFYITRLIAVPVTHLAGEAHQLALGNIDVSTHISQKDEIGMLNDAIADMVAGIVTQQEGLVRMSNGDFDLNFAVRSGKDVMNQSLNTLVDSLNSVVSDVRASATQVSTGSNQMAMAAQNLASGSTEQAASVEELSAAISEVLTQSQTNTKMAEEAYGQTEKAGALMAESMESMNQMTVAMQEINESSASIARVIKVIDDIAFQTNILALNAAVEAARAGQHGKGFAVVADEVRNLASKSAAAAKETAVLIDNSVNKVSEGNMIAMQTNASLQSVAELAASNAAGVSSINELSQKQSVAIAEITDGINHISTVVQQNSATAEQSAASAEEMSAQAQVLTEIMARFHLRSGGDFASSHQYSDLSFAPSPSDFSQSSGFALSPDDKY
jgi:methyl-accepting chemotaxis protein